MSSKPLSERAKHRLKIAALILRESEKAPLVKAIGRTDFYEGIQKVIEGLTPAEREKLKVDTDWTEQYDIAAEKHFPIKKT